MFKSCGDQDDSDVINSLISAVREGRLERARNLINSFGLSYCQEWSKGYDLLCDALENNHAEVAKLLLTSGSRVNKKIFLNTPLHLAVINGDLEIIKMILDKGANIDAKIHFGQTPLHDAIKNKKIEVTELLIKHGADVNAGDDDGTTPLHVAAEIGCLKIVEHLLEYGAYFDCVCTSRWKKGYAPLHFAVEKGNKEVITLLLKSGANVDVKGEDNITPLHIAAKKGYICIAKDLLNHGGSTRSLTKKGYTPLHFASEGGNEEAVKLFLNIGADINACTKDNLTPLHIATKIGHETVVMLLLQHGAKVDNQDKDGKTILHLAVEEGYLTIAMDVLKYCPDINNQSNRSSLKIAVHYYEEEDKKIVDCLLEYGLTVYLNPEDKNNSELLHAAVENGHLKIIEDLLKFGADVNMLNNSKEGFTPLHSAVIYKLEEVAKLLISYEADINAQDKTGKTPIFFAIQNADLKIAKLLLTNGANIKDSPELLHIAVKKECIEIVDILLQHDADINASDKYGSTALHYTVLDDYFFKKYPYLDIDFNDKQHIYNNIKPNIAKLLLSKGANIDAQTKGGLTPIFAAIYTGYAKVVEALLEYDQFNSGINNYIDLLNYSARRGQKEICLMLVNKGASVNAKHEDVLTALHIASWNGDEDLVKALLEFGAGINSIGDVDGRTALHFASEGGEKDVVETLLEYGADINVTSRNDHTALNLTMPGIRTYYGSDDEYYYDPDRAEVTAKTLIRHIVKMKTANLYVSEKNLLSMCSSNELSDFQAECEKEIASMKSEKINDLNTSFYDIFAKGTSSIAIYMRNENIVQVLKSDDYKTKFPIYASLIQSNFRKGMEKKELLEQGYKIFHFLFNNFPEVPYNCTEKIFSYLSDKDLRILLNACKPLAWHL